MSCQVVKDLLYTLEHADDWVYNPVVCGGGSNIVPIHLLMDETCSRLAGISLSVGGASAIEYRTAVSRNHARGYIYKYSTWD